MPTQNYAELEIGLHAVQAEAIDDEVPYQIELRFSNPSDDAERKPCRGECRINFAELLACQADAGQYGRTLSKRLFASDAISSEYREIKAAVGASQLSLRLRLLIGPTAPRLHFLRWEMLVDPDTGTPLATSENVLFSRFLTSDDWKVIRLQPKQKLRALVAVSGPSDLPRYGLADVDVAGEVQRARDGLAGIPVTVIGKDEPLTQQLLLDQLRTGFDILYLVCHGSLSKNRSEPLLFLQKEDRTADPVNGKDVALRVSELAQPPRLALLASCESAGTDDAPLQADEPMAAQAALAPSLAQAGVPAILAMQGRISMDSVRLAMPVFFRELLVDGQIDRAMAVARAAILTRADCWTMTLFLRLRSGQIWYEAGFTGDGSDYKKWASLCAQVKKGDFIPILGPDVDADLFGGMQEVSRQLATQHTFPMTIPERSDVSKVLQYLSISQSGNFAQGALPDELLRQVVQHTPELPTTLKGRSLPETLDWIAQERRNQPDDPFHLLADLPASIYITASPETMLLKSLRAAKKNPEPLFCLWRSTAANHPSEPQPKGKPSQDAPLVYHVFGTFGNKDSLVLTEDDFFDYLIAMSTYKLIPTVVRGSLVHGSLLFLGFRLDDWTFRVLFRLIMTLEGTAELRSYSHVGVQVSPDEHSMADVKRARVYLESYFGKNQDLNVPSIDIFWGSAREFLKQLRDHLKDTADSPPAPVALQGAADGWF